MANTIAVKDVGFTSSKFSIKPNRHHTKTSMKVGLLHMMYSNPFTGLDSEDPYTKLWLNQLITLKTMKS